MKNMVVSTLLLLVASSAFGQQLAMTVCTENGARSVNEIRIAGETMTMTVDGIEMAYEIRSRIALNAQKVSKVVGDQVIEATQYVTTAPQGTIGNPIPANGDIFQLATTTSGNQVMIFPGLGVVASSQACK